MTTPHKHAALIKAWADGATIEVKEREVWVTCGSPGGEESQPGWFEDFEYRVKPQLVVRWVPIYQLRDGALWTPDGRLHRDAAIGSQYNPEAKFSTLLKVLKVTLDPDTGDLIDATTEAP